MKDANIGLPDGAWFFLLKRYVLVVALAMASALLGTTRAGPSANQAENRANTQANRFGPLALAEQAVKSTTTEAAKTSAEAKAKLEKTSAAAKAETGTNWQSMFDGRTLTGWKASDFAGHGDITVEKGQIILPMGNDITGITWTNELPRYNYEVSLEAMRVDGSDFFCGLTFPVKEDPCSLIMGGWGGGVVGLSSLDGMDASENETTTYINFTEKRWYRVRLRVGGDKIQAWLDDKPLINVTTKDRKISIRIEVEESKPFGIATWRTTGALRNLKIRRLDTEDTNAK